MKNNIEERVERIMENRPDTRDNDLKLFAKYMNYYHDIWLTEWQVQKMVDVWISYASIIRARSKIQNTLKYLQPSEEVKILRKQTQANYRSKYWPMYKKDL